MFSLWSALSIDVPFLQLHSTTMIGRTLHDSLGELGHSQICFKHPWNVIRIQFPRKIVSNHRQTIEYRWPIHLWYTQECPAWKRGHAEQEAANRNHELTWLNDMLLKDQASPPPPLLLPRVIARFALSILGMWFESNFLERSCQTIGKPSNIDGRFTCDILRSAPHEKEGTQSRKQQTEIIYIYICYICVYVCILYCIYIYTYDMWGFSQSMKIQLICIDIRRYNNIYMYIHIYIMCVYIYIPSGYLT